MAPTSCPLAGLTFDASAPYESYYEIRLGPYGLVPDFIPIIIRGEITSFYCVVSKPFCFTNTFGVGFPQFFFQSNILIDHMFSYHFSFFRTCGLGEPLLTRDSPDCSSQSLTMVAQWATDRDSGPELSR